MQTILLYSLLIMITDAFLYLFKQRIAIILYENKII